MLKMKLVECPMVSTYKAVFDNIVMGNTFLILTRQYKLVMGEYIHDHITRECLMVSICKGSIHKIKIVFPFKNCFHE